MLQRIDLHVHSSFSDGEPGFEAVIERAAALGLDCLALTDHYDPFDEARECPSEESLMEYFARAREFASSRRGLRVLLGVETCCGPMGELRLSDRVREASDLVIASPHYVEFSRPLAVGELFDDEYWAAYKAKVLRMASSSGADVLGHCEGYLPFGAMIAPGTTSFEDRRRLERDVAARYFDEAYVSRLAEAARATGIAIELHCATLTPREGVIARLAGSGVRLSLGSDAHSLDRVGAIDWGYEMLRKHGASGTQYLPRRGFPEKGKGIW